MAIRSFLAFELPPEIRKRVGDVLARIRQADLNIRWVPLANIHLTMVFLGSIREEDIPVMAGGIAESCAQTAPFPVSLQDLGCFPGKRSPRVLWLGLKSDVERMSSFRDTLQTRLLPFGIQQEKRPFKPHLTLGRFKKADRKNGLKLEKVFEHYQGLGSPEQKFDELIQFRSDLKPTGAVYTKIASWKLEGERPVIGEQ